MSAAHEILFRGKRMDNGRWVYGDLRQDADLIHMYINGWTHYTEDREIERSPFEYEVDPATVDQYTGLTDKKGENVFEGDIITGEGSRCKPDKFVIRWSAAICAFTAGEGKRVWPSLNQATISAYEIVGNIHDNPELLEADP